MKVNFILALAILAAILLPAHSAAPQLEAVIADSQLSGFNCDPIGGPADYLIRVMVTNPYEAALSINYSYYDFPSSEMVSGGRACVIAPHETSYCNLNVQVRLGTTGNGTANVPVLLTGQLLNNMTDSPSKKLNLTISHSPTSSELSVDGIIATAEEQLTGRTIALTSACDAGACCGMGGSRESLQTASYLLSSARTRLGACDFSGALSDAFSASALMRQAQASYDESIFRCNSVLELHSLTRSNISSVNSTLYSRAACGVIINESRAGFAGAVQQYDVAGRLIQEDDYAGAEALLMNASAAASAALNLSGECQPTGFQPPQITQPTPPVPESPQPQSDALSKVVGALGYIVLAAIIIVVGAALYVSMGRKWLYGADKREPGGFSSVPPEQGKPEEPEGMRIDHSKIDHEFEEWLRQSEFKEHGEKGKPGKKKAG